MPVKAIRCPQCNKTLPETIRFCAYCGYRTVAGSPGRGESGAGFTTVSGHTFSTLHGLIDAFNSAWDEGKYHLYGGDVERWLQEIHRHDLVRIVARIKRQAPDTDTGLETFLREIYPQLPAPELRLEPLDLIDFGTVPQDQIRERQFRLSVERGFVRGEIIALEPWVRLNQSVFSLGAGDAPLDIVVTVDTTGLGRQRVHMSRLVIRPTGRDPRTRKDLILPIRVAVPTSPPYPLFLPSRLSIQVEKGEYNTAVFEVSNRGDAPLNLHLQASEPWLRVRPANVRGNGGHVEASVGGERLVPSNQYHGEIIATEQSTQKKFSLPVEVTTRPAFFLALRQEHPISTRVFRGVRSGAISGATSGGVALVSAFMGDFLAFVTSKDFFTSTRCGLIATAFCLALLGALAFDRAQKQLLRLGLRRLQDTAARLRMLGYIIPACGFTMLIGAGFLAERNNIFIVFDLSLIFSIVIAGAIVGFPVGFFRR